MKTITIIFSFIFCVTLNGQKGKFMLCNWNESGNPESNLSVDQYSFIKKGKLFYYLSNNKDNIFLNIKIDDHVIQDRILKQGLTVWINLDNKRFKDTGIRYPIGTQNSRGRNAASAPENKISPEGAGNTPNSLASTIELIGFKGEASNIIPADNADSFRGSARYDSNGSLIYQMVMPIEKLAVRNSIDNDGAMPFTFGFEYGAPSNSGSGGSGQQGSSSGGSSRGNTKGAGRPSTSDLTGSMPSDNVPSTTLMWINDIKLAPGK